jgi:hypothetical protein
MIKGIPSRPACEFDNWSVVLATYRFDPIDEQQFQLLHNLSPGERIRVMLDARELAVGLIRGRVRRQHPDMSLRELNLKVLEEIERVKRIRPGPWS